MDLSYSVVEIIAWDEVKSCELDEMWSFVQNKGNQRWLWLAIDHKTRHAYAFTFEHFILRWFILHFMNITVYIKYKPKRG